MVRRFRVAGWFLLGLAVLSVVAIVSFGALRAHDTTEFNRWIGLATVAALVVAAIGTVMVLWEKIVKGTSRTERPTDADSGQARPPALSDPDPIHPLGISIYARSLRNEEGGVIRAGGSGSHVKLVADDTLNAGTVSADQNSRGVRLADHLHIIAGHIANDAAQWESRPGHVEQDDAFAAQYLRYGRRRQAAELYDSAVRVGLETTMTRAAFECVATPDEARRVASELVRWADEIDHRRSWL